MSKPTLYIICGLPASGKTTLAKKIIEKCKAFHLSEDEWLKDLIGLYDNDEMRANVAKLHLKIAKALLSRNINVVMDGGYYSKQERDNLKQLAKVVSANSELYYMKADFETLNARRIARNKSLNKEFWTTEANLKKAISFFEEPIDKEKYNCHLQYN